jgi:hypothetical protein
MADAGHFLPRPLPPSARQDCINALLETPLPGSIVECGEWAIIVPHGTGASVFVCCVPPLPPLCPRCPRWHPIFLPPRTPWAQRSLGERCILGGAEVQSSPIGQHSILASRKRSPFAASPPGLVPRSRWRKCDKFVENALSRRHRRMRLRMGNRRGERASGIQLCTFSPVTPDEQVNWRP